MLSLLEFPFDSASGGDIDHDHYPCTGTVLVPTVITF